VDKPLGLTLAEKKGSDGGVVVQARDSGKGLLCGSLAQEAYRRTPRCSRVPSNCSLTLLSNLSTPSQFVSPGGNAAKAGIKPGDTVLYTSSFFGDELWPADKVAFTRTAINAKQEDVDFIVIRGKAAEEVNVKRLKARPSPPRFGRKLTAAQKARATHICLDWCVTPMAIPLDMRPP
jgi:hypothetical protein